MLSRFQQKRVSPAAPPETGKRPQTHSAVKEPSATRAGGFSASLQAKLFGRSSPPTSAQETLPYLGIFRDGICQVSERYFTKTIQFEDINYHLSQPDDKSIVIGKYSQFLNYFDATVAVQLSFINLRASDEFQKAIEIPAQDDGFDSIRREFADFLQNQLARGNNGLVRRKYITFGIEAENLRAAKLRLDKVETEILSNFKALGVTAYPLNGSERLAVLHGQLNPDEDHFSFDWRDLPVSGLSTKDYIAPTSFDFKGGQSFRMGSQHGAVSILEILAPELTDRLLADLVNLDAPGTVTMHIRSVDQAEAIKMIKRKLTDLEKLKIEEQKKAARAGYDTDILPADLLTYGREAKSLLEELQSRNERLFLVTFLVTNVADNASTLENDTFAAAGIAQKYNCALKRLDYQQEQGLISSLLLGLNQIEIQRGLTTSSVAIFIPFTTSELFQSDSKEALYYGLNALSNNMILVDRKNLKNPNGLILGTPGSGKSFAAKREMVNVFLMTDDDIIICDPESEYSPLVNRLEGQVVRISPISGHHINPLDLSLNYGDGICSEGCFKAPL